MAVTTEEILAAARELAGRAMTDGEERSSPSCAPGNWALGADGCARA